MCDVLGAVDDQQQLVSAGDVVRLVCDVVG